MKVSPDTSLLLKIKKAVLKNQLVDIREIAEDLNTPYKSTEHILVNILGRKRVNARLIPKDLNLLQKRRRVEVAKTMLEILAADPTFIKRIITGDELWVELEATKPKFIKALLSIRARLISVWNWHCLFWLRSLY